VIDTLAIPEDEIVVNVQGDEPLIPAATIHQVAENLSGADCLMATLAVPLTDPEELFNPNVVKVLGDQNGYALYFSRSVIPYDRDQFANADLRNTDVTKALQLNFPYLRHIGIYAYRAGFVSRYINWQPTQLEKVESLEQLRVLWYGERIHVAEAVEIPPPGIDTPEDLARLNQQLQK
jgi:3-deoxy-manno-octulosonate cytidylyltransferase (CMP-KDO synthetase)